MEEEVLYKNNPTIEGKKRLNMAYLLLKNPEMVEIIEKTKGNFFHGTNANALPNILEYGLNSVNKSEENNIDVVTGEEWSRINGKRAFVSLTDCLDVAIEYADKNKCENISNSLLNFGVIIGASFENMQNLNVTSIQSDISEIGVMGNLPLENIKYLAVPEDKVEFVKKMVGQKNIAVVGVTTDPQKYGYKIYQCLKQHSLNVYGVSIKYQQIDQDPLFSSLEAIPKPIDLVVFVIAARHGYNYVDECKRLNISTIWLQPGTYDQDLLDYIHQKQIQTIEDCVLVQLGQ